ncbi:hypothetical protein HanXRQr2_Chr09g0362881 [Helianthus annuus]|uniref:Uncharacterized protein n=1 Tax=Helianthus annuus TaxID=4232 RepID=A0A9K3N649_HELAN|nr:hypothetical protein HanXRQr2_Chr09g0362881 [Helianthus annuus]
MLSWMQVCNCEEEAVGTKIQRHKRRPTVRNFKDIRGGRHYNDGE